LLAGKKQRREKVKYCRDKICQRQTDYVCLAKGVWSAREKGSKERGTAICVTCSDAIVTLSNVENANLLIGKRDGVEQGKKEGTGLRIVGPTRTIHAAMIGKT